MNIADFHIATIRAGQADDHRYNDALSAVSYDQKTHYYDLTGLNVTANEFKNFVIGAWDRECAEEMVITEWEPGVFRVSLD